MKAPRLRDPDWIGLLGRVYAGALWLYPPAHRRRFGAEMRRAFRDRCREAGSSGRGPGSVLLAELLPDLARSVGSEHFDAIHREPNPMKRLLYVLIAGFVAIVFLRPDISPAIDAAHAWKQHRQELAYDRAYSGHLQALASMSERDRRDSDDDVTTAILYRAAAQGAGGRDPSFAEAIGAAGVASFQGRADAAFGRALGRGDRWALWLAVRACPARAATCQPALSLARLEQLDPDNGAVWALDLNAALQAGDSRRARTALGRMASATRFETRSALTARAVLAAADRRPVPRDLPQNADADPAAALAAELVETYGSYLFNEYLELKPFSDYCRSTDPQARADRRADCRAAGKLMVDQANLFSGYYAWMRNADPGELVAAREAFRVRSWQGWGYRQSLDSSTSIEFTPTMWRAAWVANDHRRSFATHFPAQPPTSFQLRPEQYDPWY